MNRCSHCGAVSDNHDVCRGCGRQLTDDVSVSFEPERTERAGFFDEVISVLDTVYGGNDSVPDETFTVQGYGSGMSMELLAEEDAVVIDNRQWRESPAGAVFRAFIRDTGVTVFIAAVIAVCTWSFITTDPALVLKTYFISYMSAGFVVWFMFPFFLESTPATFMRDVIFARGIRRIRGDWLTFLLLWVISCVYAFVPLLFFEAGAYMIFRNRYAPFMFQFATVKQLEEI